MKTRIHEPETPVGRIQGKQVTGPMEPQVQTVAEILVQAERILREHGCTTPRLDAEILLAHVRHCSRERLLGDRRQQLAEVERAAFVQLINRRASREPVAYIIGQKEFWSLLFRVDSRVLIPRPDTECVLEEAQGLFAGGFPQKFVDVGTGCGCIACALSSVFPQSPGLGIDMDPNALAVATANAKDLGMSARLTFRQGDLLEPVISERVDLICANLPYIPAEDLKSLAPEIFRFEPRLALDGGADGLSLIRRLIAMAPKKLAASGWMILEVGDGQAAAVGELCKAAGFFQIHTRKDYSGVERVVAAQFQSHP